MTSKRRRRADPFGSDGDGDGEPYEDTRAQQQYEGREEGETRARKTRSPARGRNAPSLVTPEQIVANAAAAKRASTTASDEQQQVQPKRHRRVYEHASSSYRHEHHRLHTTAQVETGVHCDAAGTPDSASDAESIDAAATPAVFQCGTCRSIFGDTHALVSGNAELSLLSLSAVTNITVSAAPQTSRTGVDAGSSYHELLCSECQSVLGRQYVTTSSALDALRGVYSFDPAAIATYQFGYAQLQHRGAAGDDRAPDIRSKRDEPSARVDAMARATRACEAATKALTRDRAELLQLRDDMTKVQELLIIVNERLQQLEEADDGDDDDLEDVGARRS